MLTVYDAADARLLLVPSYLYLEAAVDETLFAALT